MSAKALQVPIALLCAPDLKASAKLVWIVAARGRGGLHQLEILTGLSRKTVREALDQLTASGWGQPDAGRPAPPAEGVSIPGDLLSDAQIGVQARLLYGILQATPQFRNGSGRCTLAHLCNRAGTSLNTTKQAVRELVQSGWLQVEQSNPRLPLRFALRNPTVARGEAEVIRARQRIEEAPFRGEAIMREYLSLLVDSDDYADDAAPGFLVNPWTDECMELDRFYPPKVAFEYNGPQHYGPTGRFTKQDAARQRGRDHMKLGICVTKNIQLVVVHAEDLTLSRMQAKVGGLLPLRALAGHEPLIAFLESVGKAYRAKARRPS